MVRFVSDRKMLGAGVPTAPTEMTGAGLVAAVHRVPGPPPSMVAGREGLDCRWTETAMESRSQKRPPATFAFRGPAMVMVAPEGACVRACPMVRQGLVLSVQVLLLS